MVVTEASILDIDVSATPERRKYIVSVDEYRRFRRDGFLVVPNLVAPEEIRELREHTEALMQGRLPEQSASTTAGQGSSRKYTDDVMDIAAPPEELTPEEKAQYFLRIHMLHRRLELHERYLLHPRVLDVLEALIGPDILALQTMLFLKGPGKPGQGWHQDSYYIPSHPDTLCGAWIAIDDVDEINGAMWMAAGSQCEPVYPPADGRGFGHSGLDGLTAVNGVSDPDDSRNDLSKVADRYHQVLVPARAGDVVFFGGHILHRSKTNMSQNRLRRSFVGHYCNARSFTQWGADAPANDPHRPERIDPITGMTNGSHILARGDTHLPFAIPRFETPCAALLPAEERRRRGAIATSMMGDMDTGLMGSMPSDPNLVDED